MKSNFLATLGSLILSLVALRIMLQTDVLMLAPLGQNALAAFAVPSRIMFIDQIVAFGIGPIASVLIAQSSKDDRPQIVRKLISSTLLVGLLTTAVCFLSYPPLLHYVVKDATVLELSKTAVFWMTASIAMRMLIFVSSMCLFAAGIRAPVIAMYALTVCANLVLNWVFIYAMGLGFSGAYLATTLVVVMELGWLLYAVKKYLTPSLFIRPDWSWIHSVIHKIGAEWLRLLSWQAESMLTLALFIFFFVRPQQLAAIGIAAETSGLLMMPLIALMRTIAMEQSDPERQSHSFAAMLRQLARPLASITALYAIVGLVLALLAQEIGRQLYHLDGVALAWWRHFTYVYALALPIFVLSAVVRGWLQAKSAFFQLARSDILASWLLFIPLISMGAYLENPLVFFAAFLLKDSVLVFALLICNPKEIFTTKQA
jgi:Na+-driven multidrug efflux pump